jgi:hypothetical protein
MLKCFVLSDGRLKIPPAKCLASSYVFCAKEDDDLRLRGDCSGESIEAFVGVKGVVDADADALEEAEVCKIISDPPSPAGG